MQYLEKNGGRVESPDGLGLTAAMAAATGYNQVTALNAMLVRLEAEGLIQREVRGKRTLSISLPSRRGASKASARKAKATRAPSAKKTRSARGTATARRRSSSTNVAAELAALGRDVDALARRVRQLQKSVKA
jgi:hypothetical protein